MLIYILWSVVFETLIPLYEKKAYDEFAYNLTGIPLLIFGTGLFSYGGFVFVRDTLRELALNEKVAINLEIIRNKISPREKIRAARSENTRFLLSAWKKGSFLMFIGIVFISAGGVTININNITK
ncbi:MAG: hypothetical protein HY959_05745 [Ignavibacteriae bacterium]|nr:hypothetical protein [Ignavibacteriota bacterium]